MCFKVSITVYAHVCRVCKPPDNYWQKRIAEAIMLIEAQQRRMSAFYNNSLQKFKQCIYEVNARKVFSELLKMK